MPLFGRRILTEAIRWTALQKLITLESSSMHSEGPLISLASGKDAIVAEMAHYGNLSRRSRTPAVSTRTVGCQTHPGFGVGL